MECIIDYEMYVLYWSIKLTTSLGSYFAEFSRCAWLLVTFLINRRLFLGFGFGWRVVHTWAPEQIEVKFLQKKNVSKPKQRWNTNHAPIRPCVCGRRVWEPFGVAPVHFERSAIVVASL